jgi:hypothetical protein
MDVQGVDPRDQTTEVNEPAYRVYFWTGDRDGAASDEYECSGADVNEVIAWANANAKERVYSLWARTPDAMQPDGVCLVGLAGWEPPTSPTTYRPAHAVSVPATASTGVV